MKRNSTTLAAPARIALAAALALGLAACSDNADGEIGPDTDVTDMQSAATDAERASMAVARPAGDFAELSLGAKIVGPQGPEIKAALSNETGNFADMRSYVACPAGMDPCDPKTAPAGTIFTYVFIVYPGEDNDPSTGSGSGNDSSDIEQATQFRMTRPAHGFTGEAGYSKAETLSAIGRKADIVLSCDGDALVWTVNAGAGGNQWEQSEPLTFYWRSTLPPAGPANAYQIEANYTEATGAGPYPAAKDGAQNACLTKTPTG